MLALYSGPSITKDLASLLALYLHIPPPLPPSTPQDPPIENIDSPDYGYVLELLGTLFLDPQANP